MNSLLSISFVCLLLIQCSSRCCFTDRFWTSLPCHVSLPSHFLIGQCIRHWSVIETKPDSAFSCSLLSSSPLHSSFSRLALSLYRRTTVYHFHWSQSIQFQINSFIQPPHLKSKYSPRWPEQDKRESPKYDWRTLTAFLTIPGIIGTQHFTTKRNDSWTQGWGQSSWLESYNGWSIWHTILSTIALISILDVFTDTSRAANTK